jgi:hypothetical protein
MLVSRRQLDVQALAARCGVHPELVERLVVLGLLEPAAIDPGGGAGPATLWFHRDQVERLDRLLRLRRDLAINYSALGLVLDLLERVEQLEAREGRRPGGPT